MSETQAYRTMIDYASNDLMTTIETVPDELFVKRPAPDANPVGFIYFHVLRHWDRDINVRIQGQPVENDLWHRAGFTEISGYDPDGKGLYGSGYGYSQDEVDGMTAGKDALVQYHRALFDETHRLLDSLTGADLMIERPSPSGSRLTTAGRLQHLIAHTYVHVGDIEYAKGLIGAPPGDVPAIV
jgi:hypothetical protein